MVARREDALHCFTICFYLSPETLCRALIFPSTDRNDGNSKTDELTTPQRGNNNRRIMKRCSASAGKLLRAARQNATGAVLWNIGATHIEPQEEERRNDPLYTWLIIFTTTTSSIRSSSRPSSCSFAQLLRGGLNCGLAEAFRSRFEK